MSAGARADGLSLALVSCEEYPALSTDDQLLAAALNRVGLETAATIWNDPDERWEAYDAIVLRSCWDYHHHPEAFLRWLDRLEARGALVYNAVPTLRWNLAKTYLRDLEASGIRITPTAWVPQGSVTTLGAIADSVGWETLIVKPTVSANAYETWRVDAGAVTGHEARFARLVRERDLMVQPFLTAILTEGELSVVFLAGDFSHAVRKRPGPGDFRVQSQFGGSAERVEVAGSVVRQAAAALAAAPGAALYARVDGVVSGGELILTELELVEPSLFFSLDDRAADRLAAALERAVRRARR
jgi:glutathione synthase/RimK-type ligase-like ATP-grasp enzyme